MHATAYQAPLEWALFWQCACGVVSGKIPWPFTTDLAQPDDLAQVGFTIEPEA